MKVEFNWNGHAFEADVYFDGEEYEVESIHMIVGEHRVDMIEFTAQFDDMNSLFIDLCNKAGHEDAADWNEP